MLIEQILNNNVVISKNEKEEEVIIIGRGIGFHARKHDIVDEDKIIKIFRAQDQHEKNKLQVTVENIADDCILFGEKIIKYIEEKSTKRLNSGLYLTLVDHINNTLERIHMGIQFQIEVLWDIKFLYHEEYEIAREVCRMIENEFDVTLETNEIAFVTLHIVNAQMDMDISATYRVMDIIDISIQTIKAHYQLELDENSITFIRFINHLQFFAKRLLTNTPLHTHEEDILELIVTKYPKAMECALEIKKKIENKLQVTIEKSDCIYLTIHIVRVTQD